ncbi:MAG: cyclic nucleotide-binding domain-containing protein [Myxococcales bacterium]
MGQAAAALAEHLARVPLFASLSPEDRLSLARICSIRSLTPGQTLCREGDPGDGLFLLVTGRASVTKRTGSSAEERLGELGPLTVIGEISLLDGMPRSATVTALEESTAWHLPRASFQAMRDRLEPCAIKIIRYLANVLCQRLRELNGRVEQFWSQPQRTLEELRTRRALHPAPAHAPSVPAPPRPAAPFLPPLADDASPEAVADFLAHVPLLKGLPREDLASFAGILTLLPMAPGDALGREGASSDAFYVVARGKVSIQKALPQGAPLTLAQAGPGVLVGEVSLIDGQPRSASVVAPEPALVLRCDRDDFERLFQGGSPLALRFVDRLASDLSRRVREADARFTDFYAHSEQTMEELAHRLAQVGASLAGAELDDTAPLLRLIGFGDG